MPGLTNLGPGAMRHHHPHHINAPPTGSVASAGSMSATLASSQGTLSSMASLDTVPATALNGDDAALYSRSSQQPLGREAPGDGIMDVAAVRVVTGAAATTAEMVTAGASGATDASASSSLAVATTSAAGAGTAVAVATAAAPPAKPPSEDAVLIVRMAQKVAGWLTGLGTAAFLMTYQWLVEPAPPGSLPVRTFANLAAGREAGWQANIHG